MAGGTCIVRKTPHILVNLSFLEIQDPPSPPSPHFQGKILKRPTDLKF